MLPKNSLLFGRSLRLQTNEHNVSLTMLFARVVAATRDCSTCGRAAGGCRHSSFSTAGASPSESSPDVEQNRDLCIPMVQSLKVTLTQNLIGCFRP